LQGSGEMKACDTAAAEGCAAGMAAADGPAADTCRMIIIYMNEDHYIYAWYFDAGSKQLIN